MNLALLFSKGKLKEEHYDKVSKPLYDQQEKLKMRIEGLTAPKEVTLAALENYNKSIEKLKNEEIKDYYTNEEILSEISIIIVYPDNRMEISLKIVHEEIPQLKDESMKLSITYGK